LFDMVSDPEELNDLAGSADHAEVLVSLELRLRQILDPERVDSQARADQAERVEAMGGEQAVRARGSFDNSPAPGEAAAFRKH